MSSCRKTGLLFLILMIITGVTLANNGQAALTFEIPASITVAGPGLTLGDLGTIHGGTPADLEDLNNISLGSAPLPGQVRTLSRAYLLLVIQQHQFRKEIVLQMGEQVEVRVEAACVRGRDFETAMTNLLPPKKPGILKKWLEFRNLPPDIWVGKDAKWNLEASVIGKIPEAGTVLFKVTLSGLGPGNTGLGNRVFNISAKLHQTAMLYRAVREIPRHGELNSADFEIVEMELFNGEEFSGELPVKIRTTQIIRRGEVLQSRFFQLVPLVHKDHEVQVVAKSGAVEIRSVGTAKEDGWLGDEIRVINRTSKKMFRARVMGEEMVEVTLQ